MEANTGQNRGVAGSVEAGSFILEQSKKEGKDQESIQSSTIPDQGHRIGK